MKGPNKQTLHRLYVEENLSQKEIAEKFDLTQPCISKRMKRWDIGSKHNGFWTDEEIEKMEELYPEDKEKLKPELDRSWNAIKLKAMELGLAKDQEEHRNSEEVEERLRSLTEKRRIKIDWSKREQVSYVTGVIDGDGYTDNKGTIGLETSSEKFAQKFKSNLESIGLNPSSGNRRGKVTIWASSNSFVQWIENLDFEKKLIWLFSRADPWMYLEGAYDSDGNFSNTGPRICSYSDKEKEFLKKILEKLGFNPSIHTNNVYIPASEKGKFFKNIDPVYKKRSPD